MEREGAFENRLQLINASDNVVSHNKVCGILVNVDTTTSGVENDIVGNDYIFGILCMDRPVVAANEGAVQNPTIWVIILLIHKRNGVPICVFFTHILKLHVF
jgi:hypothetical protein